MNIKIGLGIGSGGAVALLVIARTMVVNGVIVGIQQNSTGEVRINSVV